VNLALFDFDGTLTSKDSLSDFIQYAVGKPAYYFGLILLSPVLLVYLSGLIRNDVAKQKLMARYFKGWSFERYQQVANDYSRSEIDKIVRQQAIEKLNWHQQQGDRVIIVSASMEDWLKPWCDSKGVELLATRLMTENGIISGEFATANCHGEEKVNRVKELLNLSDYDRIFAYGDSSGDTEMLAIADECFYRKFD
jgi:phosphatidylglycerophosphatase C